MLLGAWPIGGGSKPMSTSTDKNGKCRFVLLCGSYALFLVIGAAIFAAIEAPEVEKTQQAVLRNRTKFLESHTCISGKRLFVLTTI